MDAFFNFNFFHNRIKGFWFDTVLKVKNFTNALHLLSNNLQFSSKLEKFAWSGVRSTWLCEHFPFLCRVTVFTLCFIFLSCGIKSRETKSKFVWVSVCLLFFHTHFFCLSRYFVLAIVKFDTFQVRKWPFCSIAKFDNLKTAI